MVVFLQVDPGRGETLLSLLRAYWPLWATAALGFAGIYSLLPQARTSKPIWAGLAVALAALAAGIWIMRQDGNWPEQVLFYAFSLLAMVGAVLMLSQTNPVHAALSFALVVLSVCGLFLLLAAPFLMAATIIIYAGAIVVTFLFVIMLAQQAGLASADARSHEPFLASLAGFVLLGTLWCVIDKTYDLAPVLHELDQVAQAKTLKDVSRIWGEPAGKPEARTLPALERLRNALPRELEYDVPELEKAWSKKDLDALTAAAARLRDKARALQPGSLAKDDPKTAPPPLTARNVEGLGRALFT